MSWLAGWLYRKAITIAHTDDGAQTNYQVKLLVGESSGATGEQFDLASHCATTFDDVRFTTSDGETLCDYWIESITGATPNQLATIWVEVPSVAAHPDDTIIYVYYGNAGAAAASNGTNTFIKFDNFERGANGDAVGGDWTDGTGQCDISTEQDIGDVTGFTGTRSCKLNGLLGTAPLMTIVKAYATGYAYRFRLYKENAARFFTTHGNGTERVYIRINTDEKVQYYNGAYNDTGTNITPDSWRLVEINDIDLSVPKYDIWLDGSKIQDNADTYANAAGNGTISISGSNVADGDDDWIDDFIVRQWTATEPAYSSIAAEEVPLIKDIIGGGFILFLR